MGWGLRFLFRVGQLFLLGPAVHQRRCWFDTLDEFRWVTEAPKGIMKYRMSSMDS